MMKITAKKENGGMKVVITLGLQIPKFIKEAGEKLKSCYENLIWKIKKEFSDSEIIFTKTKINKEFTFYSWNENPHKLRKMVVKQIRGLMSSRGETVRKLFFSPLRRGRLRGGWLKSAKINPTLTLPFVRGGNSWTVSPKQSRSFALKHGIAALALLARNDKEIIFCNLKNSIFSPLRGGRLKGGIKKAPAIVVITALICQTAMLGVFSFAPSVYADSIEEGDIVINEIMQSPSAVSDKNGEWFELYNTTDSDIDLNGCVIKNSRSSGWRDETFSITSSLVVPAGGYVVLARSGDTSINGGVNADYDYPDNFNLWNTSDKIILECNGIEIDRVEYDNGATFPKPDGASMILANPNLDNNDGNNWCVSTSPYGAGDLGTPGSKNDCCYDSDKDGICDCEDNCPDVSNPEQEDTDGDGIGDTCDNCPNISNSNQLDSDSDEIGDSCDNCPGVENPDQIDTDGDGIGDACDNCPEKDNSDQIDGDNDGFGAACDCDDTNPEINPDVEEICGDEIDNNCDGQIDEGCEVEPECIDSDGDGYGENCDLGPDCNDDNPNINPGAEEICDGLDNNCNGEVDEGDVCQEPEPEEPTINPGDVVINELMWMGSATSTADEWIELRNMTGQDIDLSNCQLTKISSDAETLMLEIPSGKSIVSQGHFLISNYDKDTSNINIVPDVVDTSVSLANSKLQIKLYCGGETWDGEGSVLIDTADDGSGAPLAGDNETPKKSMSRKDPPGDGILAENWCTALSSVNWDEGVEELGTPGAPNVCGGGDGQLPECVDSDGDGYYAYNEIYCQEGDDCDDNNSDINPGANEVCNNIDDNCDGIVDSFSRSCYSGTEGTEGIGICYSGTQTCSAGKWGDCEDEVLPQDEICDGLDNNCNGEIDEGGVCDSEKEKSSGGGGFLGGLIISSESIRSNDISDISEELSMRITWTTTKFSTSAVIYDTEPGKFDASEGAPNYGYAYSKTGDDSGLEKVTGHSITLTGLKPETTYYYRTVSSASPPVFSGEYEFTTGKALASQEQTTEAQAQTAEAQKEQEGKVAGAATSKAKESESEPSMLPEAGGETFLPFILAFLIIFGFGYCDRKKLFSVK